VKWLQKWDFRGIPTTFAPDSLKDRSQQSRTSMITVNVSAHRHSMQPPLRKPALGLGEDLRFESGDAVGAALVHEGEIVHLSAFNRLD